MAGKMSPKANRKKRQRGIALIVVLVLLGLLVGVLVVGFTGDLARQNKKQQQTTEALAKAKEALIGYAAGVNLAVGASRPGDLPCPDMDNDGDADAVPPCSGAALGRLPWKTLGLPDLRDGDGERLWYAVSSNFKNNPRTTCTAPGQPGCLNSDSRGTITIRDKSGIVTNAGSNPDPFTPSGVIAVVFAPGAVLQRQGSAAPQDRSCTIGVNCDSTEKCTTSPTSLTPKCNPVNYLDVLTGVEDNANFIDGSDTNGFINGEARDSSNNVVVNDRLLTITYQDLMPLLERRVTKEVFNCLTTYAAQNGNRYPWAADMSNSASGDYSDTMNTRFGRIPNYPLNQTAFGLIVPPLTSAICNTTPPLVCMQTTWPSSCPITMGTWWKNWKEQVLYGVAEAYKPAFPLIIIPVPFTPAAPAPICGSCLTLNPPSIAADKKFVVMVAGKRLEAVPGQQPRTSGANKSTVANYVEDENATSLDDTFSQKPVTATFNDYLLFQ